MAFLTRSSACPIQIATIETPQANDTSVAKLDASEIKRVIAHNKIEDVPVVVVAIAGKARRGKSFLLNLLISYLKHRSRFSDSDFKDSSCVISGMNWAGGRQAVTKGIWLWEEAFIIHKEDGSKIAILLIDTQGIGDGNSSARKSVDSQIIYMTLSMATIYIQNLDKEWGKEEREVYQICKSFGETYGGVDQLFNSFTLLYRNWVEDKGYGFRPDIFNQEIERAQDDHVACRIMNGIDKLFHHKTAWVLPEPSELVRRYQNNSSILLTDVGGEFLNEFVKFANDLFGQAGYYSSHMNSAVTGRKFIEMMEDLSERLWNWPEMTADADQLKDLYIRKAYHLATSRFQDGLEEIEDSMDLHHIHMWFDEAEKKVIEYYKTEVKKVPPYDKFYRNYLKKLTTAINRRKEMCIHAAVMKILIEEREQFHGELENMRKQMNALVEESEIQKRIEEALQQKLNAEIAERVRKEKEEREQRDRKEKEKKEQQERKEKEKKERRDRKEKERREISDIKARIVMWESKVKNDIEAQHRMERFEREEQDRKHKESAEKLDKLQKEKAEQDIKLQKEKEENEKMFKEHQENLAKVHAELKQFMEKNKSRCGFM